MSRTPVESKFLEVYIPRPPNCYMIYRSEKVRNYRTEADLLGEVHKNQRDLSVVIAQAWANEPEEVKAHYRQRAAQAKKEHAALYPGYKYHPRMAYKHIIVTGSRTPPVISSDGKPDLTTKPETSTFVSRYAEDREASPDSSSSSPEDTISAKQEPVLVPCESTKDDSSVGNAVSQSTLASFWREVSTIQMQRSCSLLRATCHAEFGGTR